MKILAFDTTLRRCSAALIEIDEEGTCNFRATQHRDMERGHSEELPIMIKTLMNQSNTAFATLDRIATTTGPGSFSGVRIGLAMARAIACALNKPIIGISTLSAIIANFAQKNPFTHENRENTAPHISIAAIETSQKTLYWQCFSSPPYSPAPFTPPAPLTTPKRIHLETSDKSRAEWEHCAEEIGKAYGALIPAPLDAKSAPERHIYIAGNGADSFIKALAPILAQKKTQSSMALYPASSNPFPDPCLIASHSAFLNEEDYPPIALYLRKADAKLPLHAPTPRRSPLANNMES